MSEEPQLGTCEGMPGYPGETPHIRHSSCSNWQPLPTDRATEPEADECSYEGCPYPANPLYDHDHPADSTPRPPLEGEGLRAAEVVTGLRSRAEAAGRPYQDIGISSIDAAILLRHVDTLSSELAATREALQQIKSSPVCMSWAIAAAALDALTPKEDDK